MIHRVLGPSRPEFRPGAVGVRAVLFALALGPFAAGCTPVAMPVVEPEPSPPPIPSIEGGTLPAQLAREAESALQEARDYLADSAFEEAQEAALGIIQHYPGAPGSGSAYEILALSSLGLGQTGEAADAAGQYLSLLEPQHPAFSEAVILQSRTFALNGEFDASLLSLVLIPPDAPVESMVRAKELLGESAGKVSLQALREFAQNLALDHPLGDVIGEDLEGLRSQPAVLGVILPRSGSSPGLIEYGEWVLEGVQLAAEEYQERLLRPVQLEVLDHGGEIQGGRGSVQILEEMGAIGAVGPLTLDALAGAADGRQDGLPLISPFAFLPVEEAEGVFSLSGPDPGGAEVVAHYAWDLGLGSVAVVRPGTREARVEAEVFQETFQRLGGIVAREIVYDSGATFFQAEFEQVGSLLPDGLFLPLTARDIQLLAPQFTYYGLDTLGIQLLGTSGWTEDEVVLDVDSRHTDGVIASTTRISQDETVAFQRFREGYEALFQKTLRNEVPAYGYDAAALLLQALDRNPRNNLEFIRAMEEIEDFPGATGQLSVEGGRVLRTPQLIRIQNHELIFIRSPIH